MQTTLEQYIGNSGMCRDEAKLWDIISRRQGITRAVSVKDLSRLTGLPSRSVTHAVKNLIEAHHKPIGSTTGRPPGYFIIASEKERRKARASLIGRAVSILNRARVYDNTGMVEKFAGQLSVIGGE
jgi:hypothetical protein